MENIVIANPVKSGETITMSAYADKSRSGFKHVASTDDGINATCYYINRTWEVYRFQSVLHNLAWKWIEANTGLKPKTKRDKDAFYRLFNEMSYEIDRKMNG